MLVINSYFQKKAKRYLYIGGLMERRKDKESTRGLFSFQNFLLHLHGCVQQKKAIKVGRALSPGTLKVVIEKSRTE